MANILVKPTGGASFFVYISQLVSVVVRLGTGSGGEKQSNDWYLKETNSDISDPRT